MLFFSGKVSQSSWPKCRPVGKIMLIIQTFYSHISCDWSTAPWRRYLQQWCPKWGAGTLGVRVMFHGGTGENKPRRPSVEILYVYVYTHTIFRSSIPGRGERIFPLASVSRPPLGPTQLPVQWVPGVLSLGRDADHSPPSSAEVENERELYFLSPQASSWRVVGQL
jgi:hypothetical protein